MGRNFQFSPFGQSLETTKRAPLIKFAVAAGTAAAETDGSKHLPSEKHFVHWRRPSLVSSLLFSSLLFCSYNARKRFLANHCEGLRTPPFYFSPRIGGDTLVLQATFRLLYLNIYSAYVFGFIFLSLSLAAHTMNKSLSYSPFSVYAPSFAKRATGSHAYVVYIRENVHSVCI